MVTAQLEQPRQAPQRTNRLAIASLILGTTTIFLYLIWLILAAGFELYARPGTYVISNLLFSFFLVAVLHHGIPLYLTFLTNLASLITGILALVQIRKKGGAEKGHQMAIVCTNFAIAGIVIEMLLGACVAIFSIFMHFD